MNFDKHSNFNPKANFSEVKFGENMPVLEVELNEMQQIQNEARADVVRDSIPSGFVTLGEIDYDYCKSNDNQIKLKTESVAYVNGYRITIPKDTIIEIGESDKVREDLVFLEVWKEAVNDIDTLTEYGGEDNAVITNPIKDSRYPVATSQRVALKYRIRHVADLDFNKKWTSGTSSIHPYIGWNNTNSFSNVYAIGGDKTITKPTSVGAYKLFRCATYDDSSYPKFSDDSGLWVAGRNDETSFEYFKNACIDGYVYAIPMFRLLRKPNVGLASPFEYKKIHNQLDPKKFAHLVGQENVEKAHSVNVKGRTLHNLHHTKYRRGKYTLNASNSNWYSNYVSEDGRVAFDITNTEDSGWKYIHLGGLNFQLLKPSTKYLVIFEDVIVPSYINISFKTQMDTELVSSYGKLSSGMDRVIITTTSEMIEANQILYAYVSTEKMGHFELKNVAIYEYVNGMENWDKSMFSFEPGIKSLGELDNNSITVENNLVEEGTYVHELQNHILPTHPEVTHVSWGEDVVIPPEVEIELKRGEEVIQTITQLPARLETTGEEKLHVKTMKGRTLVNLLNPNESVNTVTVSGGSQSWIAVGSLISTLDVSKKYLVKLNVKQNTVDNLYGVYLLLRQLGVQGNTQYVPVASVVENGYAIITLDSDKTQIDSISIYAKDSVTSGSLVFDSFTIIEYQEGMENWVNKSFSGMKSVEEPNIRVVGKNLYTHQKAYIRGINNQDVVVNVPVSPNTTYTFDASSGSWATVTLYNTSESESRVLGGVKDSKVVTFTTDSSEVLAKLSFFNGNNTNIKDVDFEKLQIQFVEGSDIPPYELGKLNELKTPKGTVLRSLNPSLFDSIDFKTGELTSKIGETTITGKNSENNYIDNSSLTEHTRYRFQKSNLNLKYSSVENQYFKSNVLPCITTAWNQESEGFQADMSSPKWLWIRVKNSRLSSTDIPGVTAWLDNNPVTVQYEFSSPITKKIGLSEDDYVGKSKITYQLAEPLHKVGTYSDFIKGNTLFSNIGVEVLNGSEEWVRQTGTDYGFYVSHPNSMPSTPLISPQLPTLNGWEGYARKGIFRGSGAIGLVVSAGDLSENTLQGFKNWLQDNPVTIYYVKANPMEIPLKEVSPLECDFSLYRQFDSKYTGYPKELPNGVRDVVIGKGIIKRYTRHLTFNGTESWNALSTDGDVVRAFVNVTTSENLKPKAISEVLNSYKLPFGTSSITREEIGVDQNSNIVLALAKSRLSSADLSGFKNYLGQNPIQVILEVNSPYQNTVTEDKCKPIPYMPLNSYVGSLYVADGINQTKFLTAFSPSEYEVQTYHRYFSNEFNVFEDIKRKKSPYGHKTYLEEVEGKYVEKFTAGLEKHEIEDLRHKVSLTGFDYNHLLQDSFLKLIKGELS